MIDWQLISLLLLGLFPLANVIGSMNCGPECAGCQTGGCQICTAAGCGWTVETGTATTGSTVAITASNTLVTSDTDADSGTVNVRLSATVQSDNSNNVARLFFKYTDASNYWFLELVFGTAKTLRIYERISGTSHLRASQTVTTVADGTQYALVFCYGEGIVTAQIGSTTRLTYTTTTADGTPQTAGVSSGAMVGTLTFSNITYEYGYASPDRTSCTRCQPECPYCDDNDVPVQWKVTIGGSTVNLPPILPAPPVCTTCSAINGVYYSEWCGNPLGTLCVWKSPSFSFCSDSYFVVVTLEEEGGGGGGGRINIGYNTTAGCNTGASSRGASYTLLFEDVMDCRNVDHDIPVNIAVGDRCDGTSSTCHLETV